MSKLYQWDDAIDADATWLKLRQLQAGFSSLEPGRVVLAFNELSRQPPWGSTIEPRITAMVNCRTINTG